MGKKASLKHPDGDAEYGPNEEVIDVDRLDNGSGGCWLTDVEEVIIG